MLAQEYQAFQKKKKKITRGAVFDNQTRFSSEIGSMTVFLWKAFWNFELFALLNINSFLRAIVAWFSSTQRLDRIGHL